MPVGKIRLQEVTGFYVFFLILEKQSMLHVTKLLATFLIETLFIIIVLLFDNHFAQENE